MPTCLPSALHAPCAHLEEVYPDLTSDLTHEMGAPCRLDLWDLSHHRGCISGLQGCWSAASVPMSAPFSVESESHERPTSNTTLGPVRQGKNCDISRPWVQ